MGKYSGNYASGVHERYPKSLSVSARGRNLKVVRVRGAPAMAAAC